jgi:two-component system cell cycle sensor histidine kinase/response regulator CckA
LSTVVGSLEPSSADRVQPVNARVILVIEDNPSTRKIVRLTLGNEGFTVMEAGDAAEALAMVSKTPPDLILQDLLLPDMDGFELISRLRGLPQLLGVPIIAFSGFLSRVEHGRAAAIGFTDFLPKPVEPSRLVQVVRAHLAVDIVTSEEIGRGQRVLVVDDDPVQLKLASLRLTGLGFAVATATDGTEALDVLERGDADAVVSDILMPRLDGFGLCVAMRKDPRLSHVPLILVSSNYVEDADRQLAHSMGASAFVVRTPDLAGVIQALNSATTAPSDRPNATVQPDAATHHQHHERVLRQLERQSALNAAFAHRSSMHASMLSVVAGVSEALTRRHSAEDAAPDILASLLEASGLSVGALFVRDARPIEPGASELDDFLLRAHMGFSMAAGEEVRAFFAHPEIFQRAVAAKSPVVVRSAVESSAEWDLLARAGMTSALVVPCVADEECLGIVLLGSRSRDLTGGDWIPFARTIAVQIGQALSLSRAFSKLAASENRYRLLVEGASDCIFTLDKQGYCRDVNPAMERFLGRSRSDVIGAPISAFVAPDDRERSTRDFGLVLEQGSIFVESRRFTRPDKSVVIGDLSATTVEVEGGLVSAIMRDVTEKNRADAEIRLLQSLTLAASEAPDLVSAFEVVLQRICQINGWTVGAAWVPQFESAVLGCVCFWTRDAAERARFNALGEPVFKSAEGLLGQAWSTKRPVWVRDLATQVDCSRSAAAARLGIHAALAVPVVGSDGVIAVVEFFMYHARRREDERLVNLVSAICGQLASILARKSAEEESRHRGQLLERAEQEFRSLFAANPLPMWINDLTTSRFLEVNEAAVQCYGYERDEFLAMTIKDIRPTEDVDTLLVDIGQRQPGEPWQGPRQWRHRVKSGQIIDVDITSHTITFAGRSAALVVAQDITERKRSAEALRTAEERTRFALEAAGVGIWDMDYTTGVHRWSETLEAHYGLQPGTFGGTFEAFVERIHPDDRAAVLETLGKAMKSGTDFSVLNRTIWPDGSVRWLEGAGRVLLDQHGEPLRAVGIYLDVTERRALEDQFQQAQKMEAIGRLAGGVAHDFNNLLTVILGFSELLLTDLDPGDPRQADMAEIQKAGKRGAGLTRQLLAFSRKQIIEPTLLDLNVVVVAIRAMLGRLIGEDVKVVLSLRPDLAPVKADRGQVEQIVMNLGVNARDAMPMGGTLTIETANVELDEQYSKAHLNVKPGPYVALTVTDSGTGMTPEVQARLFEPFFTTKEVGKGTGLGMATVYGIVTRCGGSVGVYSEIGKGTTFKLYFPRADATEMVVDTPAPIAWPRAGTQTVLVVEDEDGVRELAQRLLERQGYTVLVASGADEVRRLVEGDPPIDVLLTDVVMPGISGPELARQLVERRPALKVIYMSGYTEATIAHHGVLNPGIAFLNKPFTSETLGRKIRDVLGG